MSGTLPVALYAAKVPPSGILVPAVPNASAMVCFVPLLCFEYWNCTKSLQIVPCDNGSH